MNISKIIYKEVLIDLKIYKNIFFLGMILIVIFLTSCSEKNSNSSSNNDEESCNNYVTQGYSCFLRSDTNNLNEFYLIPQTDDFVLLVSDNTYKLWTEDHSLTDTGFYIDRQRLAKNLYTIFDDNFDFIIAFNQFDYESNLDLSERAGYSGINAGVSNKVGGIGLTKFNYSSTYGSNGNLGSFIHMPFHYYISSGPMLHEIMHQWGNYFFKYGSGHWGVSGVGGGQLGGFDPSTLLTIDNLSGGEYALENGQYRAASNKYNSSFGSYANGGNSVCYSKFEKWLMGLIPASDVPDFKIPIKSGSDYPKLGQDGLIEADNIIHVSLSDILSNPENYDNDSIPKEYQIRNILNTGYRNPNYNDSNKNFKALIILITTNALMKQFMHETYWDTISNSWKSRPSSTKTLDSFQSSITKFALNSGDNKSSLIERKWQPLQEGVNTQIISGKTYFTIPDTNFNFWEATDGMATLVIDNLSGSVKSDLKSIFNLKNISFNNNDSNPLNNDLFDYELFFNPFK